MNVRLEFGRSRSPSFDWVLRICRKQKAYSAATEGGVEVHAIDFAHEDLNEFCAIFSKVASWANVNTYVDGQLTEKYRAYGMARRLTAKQVRVTMAIEQLTQDLKRKAAASGLDFKIRWTGRDGKKP
jgi:hypothetical protein